MSEEPTKEEVIEDIKRVNESVDGSVTLNQMSQEGKYGRGVYQHKFGLWNEAKKAAGLNTKAGNRKISREDLLEELNRMAQEYGPSVGINDMRSEGKYSGSAYINEFGSWNEAKELADLEPNDPAGEPMPDRDECVRQIQELGVKLGRAPRVPDVRQEGDRYKTKWYFDNFDGWGELLDEAGFNADPPYNKIPDQVYLDDLQEVSEKLGCDYLKKDVYTEEGQFSGKTVREHFDSWKDALDKAGLSTTERRDRPFELTREELEDEIQRLAFELDKRPTAAELNEHGNHAYATYTNRYGSWTDALEAAGFDVEDLR